MQIGIRRITSYSFHLFLGDMIKVIMCVQVLKCKQQNTKNDSVLLNFVDFVVDCVLTLIRIILKPLYLKKIPF